MILNDQIKNILKKQFEGLRNPVNIIVFTQEMECQPCQDNRQLIEEVAATSDKLRLEVYEFEQERDKDKVKLYHIDKIPALVITGEKDHHIRFYGIPSGYEFTSLIEAIKLVSTGITTLSDSTKTFLKNLNQDVHLQVLVTPTCPYCPNAVILAHQFAYYSTRIKADMVEVTEFPMMGIKYSVQGVPKTIINEKIYLEGAVPEHFLVEKISEAIRR